MISKRRKKRLFSGMSYREVQRSNSTRRSQLPKQEQKWLKANQYTNVGWDNVIKLYQKINDLIARSNSEESTLEDLFLEADRIGSKYQTAAEKDAFNEQLASEVNEVADLVDKQFPEPEFEFTDYSQHPLSLKRSKRKN